MKFIRGILQACSMPARQRLKVVNLKSSKGELALRVGDAEPFGLINIGDDAGFFREAEKPRTCLSTVNAMTSASAVRHAEQQGQPVARADRLAQIYRRLEQLARFHHGSAQHGQG
jgi:hypothetical protein